MLAAILKSLGVCFKHIDVDVIGVQAQPVFQMPIFKADRLAFTS